MKFPLIQAKRGALGKRARALRSRARAKGKVKDNGNHGGRPPYPLYETIKMGEHVPSDKLTANGACGIGRFRHPINRVPRFIGSDEIKKQSQFSKMHSIILYINNKICFLKIRLSSENTAAAFFAKLCYNWKQSFRRRAHTICAGHLPSGRLAISAACRQTQTMRACALWQIGRQRRVRSWKVPHSCQSDIALRRSAASTNYASMCPLAGWLSASCAEPAVSAIPPSGYRPPQECASMCLLTS